MKKVRIGIIGFGNIALHHALAIIWNNDAEFYAVCDSDPDRLDLAKEWGVKRLYRDYSSFLTDPKIEIVDICTPPVVRAEVAVAAAEAGKHILTEKPMCNSLAEADAMIDAARRANVKFMHAESYVFTRTHLTARKLIDDAVIGEPTQIRMNFGGWRSRKLKNYEYGYKWLHQPRVWQNEKTPKLHGGGAYILSFDHLPHIFGLARYLRRNCSIVKVFAWSEHVYKDFRGNSIEMQDTPVVTWRYNDNESGVWTRTPYGHFDNQGFKTIINGTNGVIEVLGEGGGPSYAGYKASPLIIHTKHESKKIMIEDRPDIVWISEVNYYNGAHQNELDHFIECILHDQEPMWTGCDGKTDLRLTLSAIKSAIEEKIINPMNISQKWTAYTQS